MLAKKGRARVEPATYWAATNCSTTELTPQYISRGRIAQSVERWSNKPLVMGSIPIVPIFVVFHNRWSGQTAFITSVFATVAFQPRFYSVIG